MANVLQNVAQKVTTWINQKLFRVPVNESQDLTEQQKQGIQPIPFGGPAIYPDVNAQNFIQFAYSGNASIYSIITHIARKFGYIPRYVYQIEDQKAYRKYNGIIRNRSEFKAFQIPTLQYKAYGENIVEGSPGVPSYSNLIQRPNPYQGQDAFFELVCVFYITLGESFIWLNRGDLPTDESGHVIDDAADKLPPLEMYCMPAQYIEIVPDPYDVWGILGYWFNVGGFRMYLRKQDVIQWKKPNPNFDAYSREHLRGFSPLNPGNKIRTQDDSATDAQVAMQQNDGSKGVLVNKAMTNLSPVQESQLRGVIDRKINNRDLKGAVAMLAGDWAYLNVGQTGEQMELDKSQQNNFVRLCNLWGVPPELFLTGSTYQNKLQAAKDFLTSLVLPLNASLKDEMNRILTKAFGLDEKSFCMDVDTSSLSELQEDTTRYIQELAQAWWLTPNERRQAMNEDEIEDDDNMDKIWIPNGMQPIDEAANTDLQNPLLAAGFKDQANGNSTNRNLQPNNSLNGKTTSDLSNGSTKQKSALPA